VELVVFCVEDGHLCPAPPLSGSQAGSYLRLIDFVYHSTLGLRVIKKKKLSEGRRETAVERGGQKVNAFVLKMAQANARIWS